MFDYDFYFKKRLEENDNLSYKRMISLFGNDIDIGDKIVGVWVTYKTRKSECYVQYRSILIKEIETFKKEYIAYPGHSHNDDYVRFIRRDLMEFDPNFEHEKTLLEKSGEL